MQGVCDAHSSQWGSFCVALKVALEEIRVGHSTRNMQRQERGWKLFLLLPRMLLHRSPRGDPISKDKLVGRFDQFALPLVIGEI